MPFEPADSALGATVLASGRTTFRVWAPERQQVDVCVEGSAPLPLRPAVDGYFEAELPLSAGALYRYRLDGKDAFPDPCSRFQPAGPHGPSEIIDSSSFAWTDQAWKGIHLQGQVLYELHLGAFTPEGTCAAAALKLPSLCELGVTCLELMPVNGFPGRFNWGYDGVNLFAPASPYGRPDELRAFVDRAHQLGLGVILDVVYNHFGPDGNYLTQFSKQYFHLEKPTDWGEAINFDAAGSAQVRRFFIENARLWIRDYHFDGLRLDATQNIYDQSEVHILTEVIAAVREAAGGRETLVVGESEPQDDKLVTPSGTGGFGGDGLWIDDFHHSVRVALTGKSEAYYSDYGGSPHELLACALRNSLYQGQYYTWQKRPRGSSLLKVPPRNLIFFVQNHDQVANTLTGDRLQLLCGEPLARAVTLYLLLLPQTPMLFMGQEFFASNPFLYFVDHADELQKQVHVGRTAALAQFPSIKSALEGGHRVPDGDEAFQRSHLDWSEQQSNHKIWNFHRTLLALRREDPVFSAQSRAQLDGAIIGSHSLVLRYFGEGDQGDRLLLLNFGEDRSLSICPEPLLAPVRGHPWRGLISSDEKRFGGDGLTFPDGSQAWKLPSRTAFVLTSKRES